MNVNTTPEYYFKISLQSSLKNIGIYRKFIDKVQDIDTNIIKSDNSEWRFKCYNRKKFLKIREHFNINDAMTRPKVTKIDSNYKKLCVFNC